MTVREVIDVEADLDRLYRGEPGQFVAGRNALVKRLKKAGDKEEAARVAALGRPSASAWAINRLYLDDPGVFEPLFEAGRAVRAAQQGGGGARELSQCMDDRRRAVAVILARAVSLLSEAGSGGAIHEKRAKDTLEALSVLGPDAEPPPGRLTRELSPPGFDAFDDGGLAAVLAASASRPALARPRAAPPPKPARVVPGRAAPKPARSLKRAEATRERARAEVHQAHERLEVVTEALQKAQDGHDLATQELVEVQGRVRTLEKELVAQKERLGRARQAVIEASRKLEHAQGERGRAEAELIGRKNALRRLDE